MAFVRAGLPHGKRTQRVPLYGTTQIVSVKYFWRFVIGRRAVYNHCIINRLRHSAPLVKRFLDSKSLSVQYIGLLEPWRARRCVAISGGWPCGSPAWQSGREAAAFPTAAVRATRLLVEIRVGPFALVPVFIDFGPSPDMVPRSVVLRHTLRGRSAVGDGHLRCPRWTQQPGSSARCHRRNPSAPSGAERVGRCRPRPMGHSSFAAGELKATSDFSFAYFSAKASSLACNSTCEYH